MAASLLSLFSFVLLLLHSAQSESDRIEPAIVEDSVKLDFVKELDHVKSQVHALETNLLEKDSSLREKENIISTLQVKLEMLKEKQGRDVETSLKRAESKLEELLATVAKLEEALEQKDYELQTSKEVVETLEAAEADLSSRSKQLEKAFAEQKRHIEEMERTLRISEATMLRARAEAEARKRELLKLHQHWLPAWAAARLGQLQMSQKVVVIQKWATPYLEKMRKNVSPKLKQQWESMMVAIVPHVKTMKTKMVENYDAAVTSLSPHLRKANVVVQPYVKAAREIGRPYVEKFVAAMRPHFEQVKKKIQPYTLKAARRYRRFLSSTTKYHRQLQGSVNSSLKRHKPLARFATKELVWFLASVLLLLPVIAIVLLFSSFFGTKKPPKKHVRGTSSHGHKKSRRAKLSEK